MSRPSSSTIAIWITVLGFLLTIAAVVFAGGQEKQRADTLQVQVTDHEVRLRSLESERADAAVMKRRIEDMSAKIDQVYQLLIRTREEPLR